MNKTAAYIEVGVNDKIEVLAVDCILSGHVNEMIAALLIQTKNS